MLLTSEMMHSDTTAKWLTEISKEKTNLPICITSVIAVK